MFDKHVNLLIGAVQIPPSPSTTGGSLTLMPGDTRFQPDMPVTISPPDVEPNDGNSEIAYVTDVDGLVLTLDRAQEDSTPMQVATGWIVRGSITAKTITDLEDALDDKVDQVLGKGLSTNDYDDAAESKLAGIAPGATQNASDASLRDRSTHTGSQAISTVTGLQTALDGKATPADVSDAVNAVVDAAPGTLDTLNELAAALGDDPNFATTIASQIGAKANSSTLTAHTSNTSNPHSVTKAQVGLGSADNTSDLSKPISTATQTALDAKASASHTHSQSDVTGLATALGDKLEDITGLVDEGSNVTVTGLGTAASPYVISASGGGGAVDSVNGQTGDVMLDTDDIGDSGATNKYVTAAEKTKLSNLSGVNTGDQDLGDLGVTATASELNVLDGITPTTTELNYVDGVTSAVQTQLDAKVPTSRTVNSKALSSNITLNQDDVVDGTIYKQYSQTEKTKLAGIASGATTNDTDANLKNRANHTGTQAASTISDFSSAADARISAAAGASIASLVGGLIPTSQIPAQALTTVQTAASQIAMLALTTQEGDVVVRTDQSKTYMRNAGATGTMSDFTLMDSPADVVTSVNGQTG